MRLPLPPKPFGYGPIRKYHSLEQWNLAYLPELNIESGTIQVGCWTRNLSAYVGFAFFIKDTTPGSWDMYMVQADLWSVQLVKWEDGVKTEVAEVSHLLNLWSEQMFWLGVDLRSYETDGGQIKVYLAAAEGNLIQAANLQLSVQDLSIEPGGPVGLVAYDGNVRFVDFVAGSPAHAEVADVARALDGPIIAGATKRVRFNPDINWFEWSTDGVNWTSLTVPGP